VHPEKVIERVWPGRAYTFEPLGGGITNHNFKVLLGDEAFVVRIGGKDTQENFDRLRAIDSDPEFEGGLEAAAER
jgi:hypothetical protein